MKKLLFCFIALCFCPLAAFAETVILKDGTVYKGNIPHQDEQVVYVIQNENLIKVPVSDIQEIKKDEDLRSNSNLLDIDTGGPVIKNKREFILKAGFDFYGQYRHKGSTSSEDSPKGINFSAEYYRYIQNIFGIGAGTTVQNSRDIGNTPGSFYFLPVYLGIKIRSNPTDPYKYGYMTGQVGYNFFMPDSQYDKYTDNVCGGVYYALGVGVVYNNVVFELLSSTNNGKARIQSTNADIEIEYLKYTFSVGYVFDW